MTLTEAQEEYQLYKAARDKILSSGQDYRVGDVSLTRADLKMIEDKLTSLRVLIYRMQGGRTTSAPLFSQRR